MALVYKHNVKKESRLIVYFAHQKIDELEEEIKKKKDELMVWKAILAQMKPCKDCGGEGEIRMRVAPDETETRTCEKCKGSGFLA